MTTQPTRLATSFFSQDTVRVARALIGKLLRVDNKTVRIVETEAYKDDKASHARTRTPRSAVMFDTYGQVYVYLIYGMYHCLNITTSKGPGAVLIRAAESNHGDCNGPGKLCRTLAITRKDNGVVLGKRIRILDDGYRPKKIVRTTRIGIKEDTDLLWRFYDAQSHAISKRRL